MCLLHLNSRKTCVANIEMLGMCNAKRENSREERSQKELLSFKEFEARTRAKAEAKQQLKL
jgi:hypothetical protein